MIVLGIESSCDETAAALVESTGNVLSDVVASQITEHAPYGGVVPELAARSHLEAIVPTVERALCDAGHTGSTIDGVAVTNGPGLVGSLLVGLQFAKSLAWAWDRPLVAVNHLEAHLLAVFLRRQEGNGEPPPFPFVGLLVSGGHTSLYVVRGTETFELLASTRDDAAGEAFDKAAKLLGLGYPGGPAIDRLAEGGDPHALDLPVPMKGRPGFDFSFSGLKTAVAQHVHRHGVPDGADPEGKQRLRNACASFQRCVIEALLSRAFKACAELAIPRLVIAGGVAANRGLSAAAHEQGRHCGVEVFVPAHRSCTDNAAMIAYSGAQRLTAGMQDALSLEAYSRNPGFRKGKLRGKHR